MHGMTRERARPSVAIPGVGILGLVLVGATSLGLAGCPEQVPPARQTLNAYVAALRARDYGRAYGLLSKSFRADYDRDEFVRFLAKHPKEVARTVADLQKKPERVRVVARFEWGPGQQLRLVKEAGGWRVALDPVTLYSQRTPRMALRSFLRALEHRRYRVLLRFVPRKWRRVMTVRDVQRLYEGKQAKDTQRLIRNLKANLDGRIEVKGDRAEMLYGDQYRVQFLREEGVWKIVDAD